MKTETCILFNKGEQFELNAKDTIINMESLSEHLSEQPGLIAYYGNIKAVFQEKVNALKNTIEIFMASERTKLREKSDGKRTYKEELNDQILASEDYINLVKELHTAENNYEKASVFFQAVRDKGMALNSLCSVYKAEMFVNDKVFEEKFRGQRREAYLKGKDK
jgi:hypothetical protein